MDSRGYMLKYMSIYINVCIYKYIYMYTHINAITTDEKKRSWN